MRYFRVKLFGIKWDIEGESNATGLDSLPDEWETIIEAEDDWDENQVAEQAVDELSDEFGWTTLGFGGEEITPVKKMTVTYSVKYEADIFVESDEYIQDECGEIDIPEGGRHNSVYVENSFEVLETDPESTED